MCAVRNCSPPNSSAPAHSEGCSAIPRLFQCLARLLQVLAYLETHQAQADDGEEEEEAEQEEEEEEEPKQVHVYLCSR